MDGGPVIFIVAVLIVAVLLFIAIKNAFVKILADAKNKNGVK